MAKLYIAEFAAAKSMATSLSNCALAPPATEQTPVVIGVSSAQSSAFGATTTLIRVHTDAICSISVGGANPTATVNNMRMAADQTEYFDVAPGDKLAVISNT